MAEFNISSCTFPIFSTVFGNFTEKTSVDDSSPPKFIVSKSFIPKGHGVQCSAHLNSDGISNAGTQNTSLSNESESSYALVNLTSSRQDELSASSPSSSGIVADINDSNGESNQVIAFPSFFHKLSS